MTATGRFGIVAVALGLATGTAHAASWQGDIPGNNWFAGTPTVDTNWSDNSLALSGGHTIGNTTAAVVCDSTVANAAPISLSTFGIAPSANNNTTLTIQGDQNFTVGTFSVAVNTSTIGNLTVKGTSDLTVSTWVTGNAGTSASATITLQDSATLSQTGGNSRFSQNAAGTTTLTLKGSASASLLGGGNWWLGEIGSATLNLLESATLTLSGASTRIQLVRNTTTPNTTPSTINFTGGTYNAAGVTGTGADILPSAALTRPITINIVGTAISAFGWDLNLGGPTTLRVSGSTGGNITFVKSSSNALKLNHANTTLRLELDKDGVRKLLVNSSNAQLSGMKLVVDDLPGFAIKAGQSVDVLEASGNGSTIIGIDITGVGGLTSFTDNSGADFTVSVASPGSPATRRVLRLTATQSVGDSGTVVLIR